MAIPSNENINRYSEEDLAIFKEVLEKKLRKAEDEKAFLIEQIESINENEDGDADWMDDTSTASDLELLYTQASRLSHNIRDIKNALIRIHNKSYGICSISGKLIDKRRLLAVPTTTKSLEAKTMIKEEVPKTNLTDKENKAPVPSERKIISRIISGPSKILNPAPNPELEEEEDFNDFDLDFDLEDGVENQEDYNDTDD